MSEWTKIEAIVAATVIIIGSVMLTIDEIQSRPTMFINGTFFRFLICFWYFLFYLLSI